MFDTSLLFVVWVFDLLKYFAFIVGFVIVVVELLMGLLFARVVTLYLMFVVVFKIYV